MSKWPMIGATLTLPRNFPESVCPLSLIHPTASKINSIAGAFAAIVRRIDWIIATAFFSFNMVHRTERLSLSTAKVISPCKCMTV